MEVDVKTVRTIKGQLELVYILPTWFYLLALSILAQASVTIPDGALNCQHQVLCLIPLTGVAKVQNA